MQLKGAQRPSTASELSWNRFRRAFESTRMPGVVGSTFDRTIYEFDDCLVDPGRFELRRGGAVEHVEPQVFDVLVHLIRHRERVVTKTELLDTVWGDRFVSESALASRLKSARRAVGGRRRGAAGDPHRVRSRLPVRGAGARGRRGGHERAGAGATPGAGRGAA